MALANTSGGSFDKRNVKNNTGSILNAGDSENSTDLNISDSTSVNKQRSGAVFAKDGTGSSTSDRAGIQTSVPGSELAHNSNPDEWVMFSNNVNANLQSRDYAGNANDDTTLANRGQTDSKLYGSGSLAEFNILARPDAEISTGRTKPANAGQSAKFVAPKTGGDVVSSGYRPSRNNPGKINWNLGGIPQSVNYASKERGEFELPAAAAAAAFGVFRGTVNVTRADLDFTILNPGTEFQVNGLNPAFNFTIDWGDGSSDVITERLPDFFPRHSYASNGMYNVTISGIYDQGILASNINQFVSIEEWGCFKIDTNVNDNIFLYGIVDYNIDFRGVGLRTSILTTLPEEPPEINTTNFKKIFERYWSLNSPHINNWDVSKVTNFYGTFWDAPSFNQPLNNWNTSSATSMIAMFYGTAVQDPPAIRHAFDQDISSWDFSSLGVDGLGYFGWNLNMSPVNYNALLLRWAEQADSMPNGMTLVDMGISRYSAGSAAATARNTLINTYGWTITDGGAV